AIETRTYLADRSLSQPVQPEPERGYVAVGFIESQPREPHAVSDGTRYLLQTDLPDRPMLESLGDSGCRTPAAIRGPALRQVKIAGQHAGKGVARIIVGVQQVLTHHAIVDFTRFTAVLSLHAGCLIPLFGVARTIQYPDGALASVLVHNQPMELVVYTFVV